MDTDQRSMSVISSMPGCSGVTREAPPKCTEFHAANPSAHVTTALGKRRRQAGDAPCTVKRDRVLAPGRERGLEPLLLSQPRLTGGPAPLGLSCDVDRKRVR